MKFSYCEEEQNQKKIFLSEINKFCNIEKIKNGKYIISLAYIFGIYNYSNLTELFNSNKLYLIIFLMIFISKFVEIARNFLQKNINKTIKKQQILLEKFAYLKIILKNQRQLKEQKLLGEEEEEEEELEKLKRDYEILEKNEAKKNKNKSDIDDNKSILENKKNNSVLLTQVWMEIDNIFFFRKFQRPYELLIIFTIFCYIIYKINIWSIIYILIIIFIPVSSKKII
jgi:hypothetical protein